MIRSRRLFVTASAALLLSACGGLNEAMTAHTDVVARAAGAELRVEETANLIAGNPQVPADPEVVQAVASAWVDYVLLANAVAEDTALTVIDVEAFTEPIREQALFLKLRDQALDADTTVTDEEIERRWAAEGPGAEIRARHILLRIPAEATPEQRDSVQQLAEQLRERAAGGEDFATLAQEYSEDPGSAARGGDLGFFGRGRMVAAFEEAAFSLEPGEVSEVVESPFGYHIIRLEERRQPELEEDQRAEFRDFLVQRSRQEAETEFLDSLYEQADVEIRSGAISVVREIANRPDLRLRGRAAERPLATYEGGELTAGDFLRFIRTQPPQVHASFAAANDEQLETIVQQLVRRELLLDEAERRDISLSRAEQDSIRVEARRAIGEVVRGSGFSDGGMADATPEQMKEHVLSMLERALQGQVQLVPLGRLGYLLRDVYDSEINEGTFPKVIAELEQIRASQPEAQQPMPQQMPQQMPPQGQQPQPMQQPRPPAGATDG